MKRAVDKQQRQGDIIGDAFRPHVVEKWKALARGIVEAIPDLLSLVVQNRQRAASEFRRILNIEIRAVDDDFCSGPPDETVAENIGMQRADEDADPPQRQARLHQAFAGFRHHPGRARCGPRPVDQPVGDFLQFRCVHEGRICGASWGNVKAAE
jgi:hypothetical protein